MAEKQKIVETVEVTLAKDHTHAGKEYKAGDKITVRTSQIKWLEEAGAIKTK
jgi:ribosomal 50S subunit-recycling heat shock protein